MLDRFSQFPLDLSRRTRTFTLGGVPALIAHPDWTSPAPVMIWMHGRTATKELDPGRYLRWVRAGIAAVALDLPGHGQRPDARLQRPEHVLEAVEQMIREIDAVVDALASPEFAHLIDLSRAGLGGMSAGGMATLRRICDGHDFIAAAVECTTGDLSALFTPNPGSPTLSRRWDQAGDDAPARLDRLDPMPHLANMHPIPLLLLSTTTDQMVPYAAVTSYIDSLRAHYAARGSLPALIEHRAWSNTGAPSEHAGFGKFGAEAKDVQVEFLRRQLLPQV